MARYFTHVSSVRELRRVKKSHVLRSLMKRNHAPFRHVVKKGGAR